MKKLLWLSHLVPWPPKGGVLQRSYYLLREAAREFDIHLLTFNQRALLGNVAALEEAKAALSNICLVLNVLEIPSDRSKLHFIALALKSLVTKMPYTLKWLDSPTYKEVLDKALREFQYDVIHCDTISLAPFLTDKIYSSYKTVLNHHNIESHMMVRRAEKERNIAKRLYFVQEARKLYTTEREYCKKFTLNVTCSDLDRDRLVQETGVLKAEVIPNGVDLQYFCPAGLTEEKNLLVFVGGLSWYPNHAAMRFFFDQVWPSVRTKQKDLRIDVIGRNPPHWLKQIADADQAVHVPGFVDDARPYIERATVYVCPIMDGGGTKLKILDALAMGKAIVAHPVSCEGIDVQDEEHVLFALDRSEFVQQINRLLEDASLRRRLGQNGRHLVAQKYSYEQIGQHLRALYARL